MNNPYDLFLLMFSLSQMNEKTKIIELFKESMCELFKPLTFTYSEKKMDNRFYTEEISTRNEVYGYIYSESVPEQTIKQILQNAVQMLAVFLDRISFENKLKERATNLETVSQGQLAQIKLYVNELETARIASLNLIEDLKNEIFERKEAETALIISEEKFSRLLMSLPLPIVYLGKDGKAIFRNDRFTKVFGFSEDEIQTIDDWWLKAYPDEEYRNWVINSWEASVIKAKENDTDIESNLYKITCKDGSVRQIIISGIVINDNVLATFIDITERILAEMFLQESESKFKTLVENIPQKVFMKDLDYKWIFVNKNLADDLEMTPEEVVGKIDTDFFPPELAAKYHADDERIISTGQTEDMEEKYIDKGEDRWINTVKTAIKDENNKIIGLLGLSWDITEHKLAEVELSNVKASLEMSLEASQIGIWKHDLIEDPEHINEISIRDLKHDQIFGYNEKVALWSQDIMLGHVIDEDRPAVQAVFDNLLHTGRLDFECRILWSDKSIHWIECRGKVFKDRTGQPNHIHGTIRDISERKQAEEEIKNQLNELRRWYEVTLDREGRVLELKQEVNELLNRHGEALRYGSDNTEFE
jgi:PAS domain S-box-containing protein